MKRKPAKATYTPAMMITIQRIDIKIPFNLSALYPNDFDDYPVYRMMADRIQVSLQDSV